MKALEGLREEEKRLAEAALFDSGGKATTAAAWRLGRASIEWLTLNAVEKRPAEGLREKVLFAGIAIGPRRPGAAGFRTDARQQTARAPLLCEPSILAKQAGLCLTGSVDQVRLLPRDMESQSCGLSAATCANIAAVVERGFSICQALEIRGAKETAAEAGEWRRRWQSLNEAIWQDLCAGRRDPDSLPGTNHTA